MATGFSHWQPSPSATFAHVSRTIRSQGRVPAMSANGARAAARCGGPANGFRCTWTLRAHSCALPRKTRTLICDSVLGWTSGLRAAIAVPLQARRSSRWKLCGCAKYSSPPNLSGCWRCMSRALMSCQRGPTRFATQAQSHRDCKGFSVRQPLKGRFGRAGPIVLIPGCLRARCHCPYHESVEHRFCTSASIIRTAR